MVVAILDFYPPPPYGVRAKLAWPERPPPRKVVGDDAYYRNLPGISPQIIKSRNVSHRRLMIFGYSSMFRLSEQKFSSSSTPSLRSKIMRLWIAMKFQTGSLFSCQKPLPGWSVDRLKISIITLPRSSGAIIQTQGKNASRLWGLREPGSIPTTDSTLTDTQMCMAEETLTIHT